MLSIGIRVSDVTSARCPFPLRVSFDPFFVNNGLRIARNVEIDTFNQSECRDATNGQESWLNHVDSASGRTNESAPYDRPSRPLQIHAAIEYRSYFTQGCLLYRRSLDGPTYWKRCRKHLTLNSFCNNFFIASKCQRGRVSKQFDAISCNINLCLRLCAANWIRNFLEDIDLKSLLEFTIWPWEDSLSYDWWVTKLRYYLVIYPSNLIKRCTRTILRFACIDERVKVKHYLHTAMEKVSNKEDNGSDRSQQIIRIRDHIKCPRII